jgi:hypothetical protein
LYGALSEWRSGRPAALGGRCSSALQIVERRDNKVLEWINERSAQIYSPVDF